MKTKILKARMKKPCHGCYTTISTGQDYLRVDVYGTVKFLNLCTKCAEELGQKVGETMKEYNWNKALEEVGVNKECE